MIKNRFWVILFTVGIIISCNNDSEEILEQINEEDTQEEVEEEDIEDDEEEVAFKISGYEPSELRRGYLMSIQGENFGEIFENIKVNFSNHGGEEIEAKIINVANNKIDLAIPVNAVSGSLELFVGNNSITNSVYFAPFQEKAVFSTRRAPFPQPGFYLYYLGYDNNGILEENTLSYYDNYALDIHQLDYSYWDNTFWGLSFEDVLTFYRNGRWENRSVTGNFRGYANQGIIMNTNANKKYYVDVPAEFHDRNQFNLREFDNNGNVISESGIFDLDHKEIVFAPDQNMFVTCEALRITENSYELKVNKIDASTFNLISTVADGTISDVLFSDRVLPKGAFYDKINKRLLVTFGQHIYALNLINNELKLLVSDLPGKLSERYGCCLNPLPNQMTYYEPSNEVFLNVYSPSGTSTVFIAVNLASGDIRRTGARYSNDPVVID
ncbi:hypothetical protein [uncultured Aquimarina sp.]|uniref:hypothetical protein n=1 Tax=uncultured Aquimarina sp. TaxID=575652 RepID=UPI00260F4292|nr:hypothetical protein [uncultured Aquimarina sp.]